jgi:hypothetical protein
MLLLPQGKHDRTPEHSIQNQRRTHIKKDTASVEQRGGKRPNKAAHPAAAKQEQKSTSLHKI